MDFVDFNLARKLKEKGFPQHWSDQHYILENEYEDDFFEVGSKYPVGIIYDYISTIAAPTISQVLKWFREKKMHIEIFLYNGKYSYFVKSITQICKDDLFHECLNEDTAEEEYDTYEQAALAGIEYVLDNLIIL